MGSLWCKEKLPNTWYFGTVWSLPAERLAIIIVFSIVTVIAAVYAPAKRVHSKEIIFVFSLSDSGCKFRGNLGELA